MEDKTTAADSTVEGMIASNPIMNRPDPCQKHLIIILEIAHLLIIPKSKWSTDDFEIERRWDGSMPTRHPRTSVADLADYHAEYPSVPPDDIVNSAMYNPDGWQRMKNTVDHMNTTICVIVEDSHSSSFAHHQRSGREGPLTGTSKPKERRFIQPDIYGEPFDQTINDPDLEMPWLSDIFEGIFRSMSKRERRLDKANELPRPYHSALRKVGMV